MESNFTDQTLRNNVLRNGNIFTETLTHDKSSRQETNKKAENYFK